MYDPSKIEPKWQKYWLKNKTFKADPKSKKPKQYILDMFPYPSGTGLHVGHPEGYTASDIISRYLRMKGYNVLHPMGWDAFGLPAENYAIKTKIHPQRTTDDAIACFRKQIQSIGFSYDWEREINTSAPNYYRWTQWFFLFLYKNGLAYKRKAPVNWCPGCQTVLANEQVINGLCERCDSAVVQKELEQWFFKITDFIEDTENNGRKTDGLITGLKKIDWPNGTLAAQANWIGKSEGAFIYFSVESSKEIINVFTTRPDTIFGATYLVLAPENPLVNVLVTEEYKNSVEVYKKETSGKNELEREFNKNKTGEFIGAYAINPVNKNKIPIFIADYVLMSYGTGAIMAVPGHDERDLKFTHEFRLENKERKYGFKLSVIHVVEPTQGMEEIDKYDCMPPVYYQKEGDDNPKLTRLRYDFQELKNGKEKEFFYSGNGQMINSDFLNGKTVFEAKKIIIQWLEENDKGKRSIQYKLRDWLVSRQRYWGAPIPIIYCDKCGEVPVQDEDLPVMLPDDVDFMPKGESPLRRSKKFHKVKCPKCGQSARRESDTMDTFVCSSWYMYRFADPGNKRVFADKKHLQKWCPIDLYVGGAEHTVMHLLYARFFTKALHRHGYLDFDEPFLKLRHQGLILGEDGEKMSKSRGNVINPDDVISRYGADTLRLYEMFMGPFEAIKPWSTKSIEGCFRFLQKVWRILEEGTVTNEPPSEDLNRLLHKTIKKVTEDIERFAFNTAISAMMILANEAMKEKKISKELMEKFILILSPFAPHMCEEMWEILGHKKSLAYEKWPTYDSELVQDKEFELVFAVNGKMRGSKKVSVEISEEKAVIAAMADESVKRHTEGKTIIKKIYVPGKLVNIVVK